MKRTSSRILNGLFPGDVPRVRARAGSILECASRREDPMKVEITYCVV